MISTKKLSLKSDEHLQKNSYYNTRTQNKHEVCINIYEVHIFMKSHQHCTTLSDTEHHKNHECSVIINQIYSNYCDTKMQITHYIFS